MITSASRAPDRVHKSRASNSRGYIGLKYERSVVRELARVLPRSMKIEHNPWFFYTDDGTNGACSPDVLIHDNEFGYVIVAEVKNTWVSVALPKLNQLYCPVVAKALNRPTKPIVIVKNLIPGAPRPQASLSFALVSEEPLLQWIGT